LPLEKTVKDVDTGVRLKMAERKDLPIKILKNFARDSRKIVREAAKENLSLRNFVKM
jgi:hypothetical protein